MDAPHDGSRRTAGGSGSPVRWLPAPEGPAVVLLDQTRLPAEEADLACGDVPALVDAIRRLVVRGAPLLGIAGAYGVALAAARGDDVRAAAAALATARPTAVNLATGVARALRAYETAAPPTSALDAPSSGPALTAGHGQRSEGSGPPGAAAALAEARALEAEEAAAADAMAAYGLALVPPSARILTHCNTGSLAVGGIGSAFGLALAAHRAGRLATLWVDETRPLLQGSRLTAYEARREGLPYAVLPDSAAASLMAAGQVDLVVTGADRVAADGSVANKVGTYSLAVLCAHHGVPFVVAAPLTTLDPETPDGAAIVVEQRAAEEVTRWHGRPVAPEGSAAYNPAFDVTPPELVTALVTDAGIASPVNRATVAALLVPRTG